MNKHVITVVLFLGMAHTVQAKNVVWCVYDIAGTNGATMQLMKDYILAAKSWGVESTLKAYNSDERAVADYKAQKCDAVVASTSATKDLNNFTGTIGAVGLIPTPQVAKSLFLALGSPKVARYMKSNGHEVVGWQPWGSAYFMVKDRRLNSITQLAGKRLSVLKDDISQIRMARRIGATPVMITFDDAGSKFLNGSVDILAAPIYAYQPLELNRVLADRGGVINFPVSYIALSFIIREDAFPKGFGQKSRNWFKLQTPSMINQVMQWERGLPLRYWYDIPVSDRKAYQRLVTQLRTEFVDNSIYHPVLVKMVHSINCSYDPEYFECK